MNYYGPYHEQTLSKFNLINSKEELRDKCIESLSEKHDGHSYPRNGYYFNSHTHDSFWFAKYFCTWRTTLEDLIFRGDNQPKKPKTSQEREKFWINNKMLSSWANWDLVEKDEEILGLEAVSPFPYNEEIKRIALLDKGGRMSIVKEKIKALSDYCDNIDLSEEQHKRSVYSIKPRVIKRYCLIWEKPKSKPNEVSKEVTFPLFERKQKN